MTIALRPYQQSAIDGVREAFRAGHRAPLLVAPTGAGKTVMFGFVAGETAKRGKRVLIVAHRRELIRQASRKLTETGVDHGIIAPGFTPSRDLVQVGSVQTLVRRMDRIAAPDLIVIDEAHHAVAGQWADVIAAFPAARIMGVTATPERLDGKGLGVEAGGCFDALIMGPAVLDLMEAGFLSPTRVFAPAEAPDLGGIRTVAGDYAQAALGEAMQRPKIVGDAIAHYAKYAEGQPAILFSPSVAHADTMAAAFRAAGYRAASASGATPAPERDAAIAGLATGAVQILCSCDLISEGLDVPAVGCVILMRPTKSLGLYLQQVGRGLRPAPGKSHLIVLDHAGNSLTHGMIEQPRDWSLAGRKKGQEAPAAKQCPSCYAVHAPASVCPSCGHSYAEARDASGGGREEPMQVDGELAEVDREKIEGIRNAKLADLLKLATSEKDLREIAKARGFKPGWVRHVLTAKHRAHERHKGAAA